jgi:hypothetical protein
MVLTALGAPPPKAVPPPEEDEDAEAGDPARPSFSR